MVLWPALGFTPGPAALFAENSREWYIVFDYEHGTALQIADSPPDPFGVFRLVYRDGNRDGFAHGTGAAGHRADRQPRHRTHNRNGHSCKPIRCVRSNPHRYRQGDRAYIAGGHANITEYRSSVREHFRGFAVLGSWYRLKRGRRNRERRISFGRSRGTRRRAFRRYARARVRKYSQQRYRGRIPSGDVYKC